MNLVVWDMADVEGAPKRMREAFPGRQTGDCRRWASTVADGRQTPPSAFPGRLARHKKAPAEGRGGQKRAEQGAKADAGRGLARGSAYVLW